jgi:hypothetical protein
VLEQLTADPEKLRSLTGWDWIRHTFENYSLENTAFY